MAISDYFNPNKSTNKMTEPNETDTMNAAQLGAALTDSSEIDNTPYVVVPIGFQVSSLESFKDIPARHRGNTVLRDVRSFNEYVNNRKTGSTLIYGAYTPPVFKAVFNDHLGDTPGWRDDTATYACPHSIEWVTWQGRNGRHMSQTEFAQFIEDNLPDIANPPAADMLEISRSLEAKKKVDFASGVRLSNGQNELTYTEEISGTASKGKLQVPEQFTIGIPVLEGGTRYAVPCRLRYRIADGGKLTIWYEMVRPHKVLEDAVNTVWSLIQTTTEIKVLNGCIG